MMERRRLCPSTNQEERIIPDCIIKVYHYFFGVIFALPAWFNYKHPHLEEVKVRSFLNNRCNTSFSL